VEALVKLFNAKKHPDVLKEYKSEAQVFKEFTDSLDILDAK